MNFLSSVFGGVKDFLTKPTPSATGSGQSSTGLANIGVNLGRAVGLDYLLPSIFGKSVSGDIPRGLDGTVPTITGSAVYKNELSPQSQSQYSTIQRATSSGPITVLPGQSFQRATPSPRPSSQPVNVPAPSGIRMSRPGVVEYAPPQGTPGTQGTSNTASLGTFRSVAGTGNYATGTPGSSGASSGIENRFIGFGSGAGGSVTQTLGQAQPDEQQQKTSQSAGPSPFIPLANQFSLPQGFSQSTTPQGGTAYRSPEGYLYTPDAGGLKLAPSTLEGSSPVTTAAGYAQYGSFAPQVQVQPNVPQFKFSGNSLPDVLNFAGKAAVEEATRLLATPGVKLTPQQFNDIFQQKKSYALEQINASTPNIPNPVVDTPEQLAWLNQFSGPQKTEALNALDATRSQLGLPNLESQLIETRKQLQAENEAFLAIAKDLKDNPELPKGLIQRRLQEADRLRSNRITSLTNQLDILNTQIGFANDRLNREFNIVKFQQEQKDKSIDNQRAMLQQLITSGAIGQLSNQDLRVLAQSTGQPISQLMAMKNASSPKSQYSNVNHATDENGNITVYGINNKTGKAEVISSLGAIGKGVGSNGTSDIIDLYSGVVQQALNEGATPQEAVLAAASVAKESGDSIGTKDRKQLLEHANTIKKTPTATFQPGTDPNRGLGEIAGGLINSISNFLFR